MAEANTNKEGIANTSETSDSDHVIDFFCELCRDDGKYLEAGGYCVDCDEYLCDACFRGHKRPRPTRHHVVLDKENMPTDAPLSPDKMSRDIATKCPKHEHMAVEYYCSSHDELGCGLCFVRGHSNCGFKIEVIADKLDVIESNEYINFIKEKKTLEQGSRGVISKTRSHIVMAEHFNNDAVMEMTRFRGVVDSKFDKFEHEIATKIDTIKSEDTAKMNSLSDDCEQILDGLERILLEFDHLQSSKRACQVYIKMKETKREVKRLDMQLKTAERKNVVQRYQFDPNVTLVSLINSQNGLGQISIFLQMEPKYLNEVFLSPGRKRMRNHRKRANVNDTACITSCAMFSSNIVAADQFHKKILLLDIGSKEPLSFTEIVGDPWDLTVVDEQTVAVTVPSKHTILKLQVSRYTFSLKKEIKVRGECYGVDYSLGRLVVSFIDRPKLEVIDLDGTLIKTIENDNDGNRLFDSPKYVCTSTNGDTIYVSDSGRGTVCSLTFDGVMKAVYDDGDLGAPRQVCLDHHGNVYVCDYEKRNVHMMTPKCTKLGIILTKSKELSSGVCSVCHCPLTNRLFVGMEKSSAVKMFQL